ncbi:MAG: hypothetical protein Ct9H300mP16_12390 [Pseudomonadota bacterium]|nr:MAG: hypothetical protein Ct9H300mP16_12390 [Pseudomonadota bacterium]
MHGLPDQSMIEATHDIESAIPSRRNTSLCINSPLNRTHICRRPSDLPDEETCWQIRCILEERAADAGYERYEVSAFSRRGNPVGTISTTGSSATTSVSVLARTARSLMVHGYGAARGRNTRVATLKPPSPKSPASVSIRERQRTLF